jgi:hypothetical protein
LLYGSECWTLTKQEESGNDTVEMEFLKGCGRLQENRPIVINQRRTEYTEQPKQKCWKTNWIYWPNRLIWRQWSELAFTVLDSNLGKDTSYPEVFRCYPHSLQEHAKIRLRHDRFLPNPFQLISHFIIWRHITYETEYVLRPGKAGRKYMCWILPLYAER